MKFIRIFLMNLLKFIMVFISTNMTYGIYFMLNLVLFFITVNYHFYLAESVLNSGVVSYVKPLTVKNLYDENNNRRVGSFLNLPVRGSHMHSIISFVWGRGNTIFAKRGRYRHVFQLNSMFKFFPSVCWSLFFQTGVGIVTQLNCYCCGDCYSTFSG